jgi:hypothetical protein
LQVETISPSATPIICASLACASANRASGIAKRSRTEMAAV